MNRNFILNTLKQMTKCKVKVTFKYYIQVITNLLKVNKCNFFCNYFFWKKLLFTYVLNKYAIFIYMKDSMYSKTSRFQLQFISMVMASYSEPILQRPNIGKKFTNPFLNAILIYFTFRVQKLVTEKHHLASQIFSI